MNAKDTPADTGSRWRSRGPRKLPWILDIAVTGLLVLVLAILFREVLFSNPVEAAVGVGIASAVAGALRLREWKRSKTEATR